MPEWTRSDAPTSGTEPHRRLALALEDLGLAVEIEVQVGPYRVDCYVRELHLAFEADGPLHDAPAARRHDQVRDAWLRRTAALPVIRVRTLREREAASLMQAIDPHRLDAEARRFRAQESGVMNA